MRIGVLEWASCGGASDAAVDLPDSIRQEGLAMCQALIDSLFLAGHTPVACIDFLARRMGFPAGPHNIRPLDPNRNVRDQWRETYAACDATIVVAPESDGVQLELEAWCAGEGILTCESDAHFLEYAGDKWLMAQRFQEQQVSHPPTQLLSQWTGDDERPASHHWAIKARDGAGCEGMQVVSGSEVASLRALNHSNDRQIVQPWLSGQAYSRSAIVDASGRFWWLPVVSQQLTIASTVHYEGGCVEPELVFSAQHCMLLERSIRSLGGQPRGWVGVDFLLSETGQLTVIEINPRLTTSFVGLSQACDVSLADLIVKARLGQPIALPPIWRRHSFSVV